MSAELEGRLAVVTGASRGIGRAIALELAARGCDVAFNYRSREAEAASLRAEIEQLGRRALAYQADVGDAEAVAGFFREVATLGDVDFLINNAGISHSKLAMSTTQADWQAHLDTNLTGAFLCVKAVVVGMMKRRRGRIVNVSSAAALRGLAGTGAYAASKSGLLGYTRALARELGPRGVTVNAVAPGFVETEMIATLDEEARAALTAQIPLGGFGEAADVAQSVAFLLGPGGRYITGQVLVVDGGLSS
ncbi:MAG TPA: 3-oxoacyl-ACP reductase family protein [Oscillatoriaceae cyanobacterium]